MNLSPQGSDGFQDLLSGLEKLLPIGLALAAWAAATWAKLKKRPEGTPPAASEAERTRRIQEEVRRKIAERRGRRPEEAEAPVRGAGTEPSVAGGWRGLMGDLPPLDPFGGPRRRRLWPGTAPASVPRAGPDELAELERQQRVVAPALASASVRPAAAQVPGAAATADPVISPWLAELREPAGVRRAIVLREILGTPVGLR